MWKAYHIGVEMSVDNLPTLTSVWVGSPSLPSSFQAAMRIPSSEPPLSRSSSQGTCTATALGMGLSSPQESEPETDAVGMNTLIPVTGVS